jgi:hypothetical protein
VRYSAISAASCCVTPISGIAVFGGLHADVSPTVQFSWESSSDRDARAPCALFRANRRCFLAALHASRKTPCQFELRNIAEVDLIEGAVWGVSVVLGRTHPLSVFCLHHSCVGMKATATAGNSRSFVLLVTTK